LVFLERAEQRDGPTSEGRLFVVGAKLLVAATAIEAMAGAVNALQVLAKSSEDVAAAAREWAHRSRTAHGSRS
jgi:hypothetical protein